MTNIGEEWDGKCNNEEKNRNSSLRRKKILKSIAEKVSENYKQTKGNAKRWKNVKRALKYYNFIVYIISKTG